MIVCHCKGVTDREIRAAVRSGAASAYQIEQHCDAGGDCGGCRAEIERIVRAEEARGDAGVLLPDPILAPAF